jgi:TRAP-type C4-dicarboxylate transport system permease small subunit
MHAGRLFLKINGVSITLNRLTERTVLGLGLTMTIVVVSQVVCRYLLNYSLFWSEELARYLLVWLTFLGAAVAYRRRAHPRIDVLHRCFSPRTQSIVTQAMRLLSLLFFGVMICYGTAFSYFVRNQTTPALGLPKWLIFAIIPISGSLLAVHAFAFLITPGRGKGDPE